MSIARIILLSDMSNFALGGIMRVLVRLFIGVLMADRRKFVFLHFIHSIAACARYHVWCSSLPADAWLQNPTRTMFVIMEIFGFVLSLSFYTLLQASFHAQAQAVLDARTSTSSLQAVQKMLSVLCDTEVRLGPEMEILEPSNKAVHFLSCQDGAEPCADSRNDTLHGFDFRSFVQNDDLERFMNFLELPGGPSASITLNLQDLSGSKCRRAELFQVSLPDLIVSSRCRGHLLGIRYTTEGPEVANSSHERKQENPSYEQGVSLLDREPEESFDHMTSKEQTPRIDPESCSTHEEDIQPRTDNRDVASDSASSASVPFVAHRHSLQELAGITVKCDALTSKFTVRQVVFDFCDSGQSSSHQLPQLADWLLKDTWDPFVTWAQSEMNRGAYRSQYPGHFHMRMPRSGSVNNERILEANKAILCSVETDSSSEEDDDTMFVVIRIQGISALTTHTRKSKTSRARRASASSSTPDDIFLPSIYESLESVECETKEID